MALVIWIIIAVSLVPVSLVHVAARMTAPDEPPAAAAPAAHPRPGSRAP